MEDINRREFLKRMGSGSGAVLGGILVPTTGLLSWSGKGVFTFRAVTGLPQDKLPSYASYVIEGSVNLTTRSGIITKTVYAGPPEAMSTIALPGLSRIVRVTEVRDSDGRLYIRGLIDDRSLLRAGETEDINIKIDPSTGVAQASFLGSKVTLGIET